MFPRNARLEGYDPELAQAIAKEVRRQEDHVELIASENYCSPYVMEAQGSQLTYREAIPGMWTVDRYVNLLMGEIPRLTDNDAGYGPNGKKLYCA